MAGRRRKPPPADPSPIGACFAVPVAGGRFAACQVIAQPEPDRRELITFDWLDERPPTLDDLARAQVLIVHHHSWSSEVQRCNVEVTPPASFIPLGICEPLASFAEPCKSYGGWSGVAIQAQAQHWWDHVAPNAETAAYKQAIVHAREPITFELDGQLHERPRGLFGVELGPGTKLPIAADRAVDWSAFDGFGRLDRIDYRGHDSGVVEYVTRRVLIGELVWRGHGQSRIDLSRARLRKLTLELGDEPLCLQLSTEIDAVQLDGYRGQALTIEHPERGRGLALILAQPGAGSPTPVAGLERLSSLTLTSPSRVELATLGYPQLEQLSIHANGKPIEALAALTSFAQLQLLSLVDAYTIDPEQVPRAAELPALTTVEIHGLRKSHAPILKARLAGLSRLELSGAKTDKWLAENVDNPFCDWIDEGAALGRAACKAYKQTHSRLAKLALDDLDGLHAELLGFIRAFNQLDETEGLDTVHREQVYEVFHQLAAARGFPVTAETLDQWFEADRQF
jgi:hypothetical protein